MNISVTAGKRDSPLCYAYENPEYLNARSASSIPIRYYEDLPRETNTNVTKVFFFLFAVTDYLRLACRSHDGAIFV